MAKDSKANRAKIRAPILPRTLRGLATFVKNTQHAAVLIWDISPEGLGLWCAEDLAVGEEISVAAKVSDDTLKIVGTICWTKKDAESDGYRIGVTVTETNAALSLLYEQFTKS